MKIISKIKTKILFLILFLGGLSPMFSFGYQIDWGTGGSCVQGSFTCADSAVASLYDSLIGATGCTSSWPNYQNQTDSNCSVINTIYTMDSSLSSIRAGLLACIMEKRLKNDINDVTVTQLMTKLKGVGSAKLANGISILLGYNSTSTNIKNGSEFVFYWAKLLTSSEYVGLINDINLDITAISKFIKYLSDSYLIPDFQAGGTGSASITQKLSIFPNVDVYKIASGSNLLFDQNLIDQGSQFYLYLYNFIGTGYYNNLNNTGFSSDSIYKMIKYISSNYLSTDLNSPNPYSPLAPLKKQLDLLSGVNAAKIATGFIINWSGFTANLPVLTYGTNIFTKTNIDNWGYKFLMNLDDDLLFKIFNNYPAQRDNVYRLLGRLCMGGKIVDGSSSSVYSGDVLGRYPCMLPTEFYAFTSTNLTYVNYLRDMILRDDIYLYVYKDTSNYKSMVGPVYNYPWHYRSGLLRGLNWIKASSFIDTLVKNNLLDKKIIVGSWGYFDWNYKTGSLVTGDESLVTEIPQLCQNLSGDTIVSLYHTFEDVNNNGTYGGFSDMLVRRQICINRSGKSDYIMDKLVGTGDSSSVASYYESQDDTTIKYAACNGSFTVSSLKNLMEYYVDNNKANMSARFMNIMGANCVNTGASVSNLMATRKLGKTFEHVNLSNTNSQNLLKNTNLQITNIKNLFEYYVSGTGNNLAAAANQLNLLSMSGGDLNKASQVTNLVRTIDTANIFNHANMSISNSAAVLNNNANLTVANGSSIIMNLSGISYTRLYNILMDSNIINDRIASFFADNSFDQGLDIKITKDTINSNLVKIQDIVKLQSTKNLSKTVAKIKQMGIEDGYSTLIIEERADLINSGTGYVQKLFSYSGNYLSSTEGANIIYGLNATWNSGGIVTGDLVRNIVNAIDDKYMHKVYAKLGVDNGGLLMGAVGRYCIGGNIIDGSTSSSFSGDAAGRFPCTIPVEFYSYTGTDTNTVNFATNMFKRNDMYMYTYKQVLDYTQIVGPINNFKWQYKTSLLRGMGWVKASNLVDNMTYSNSTDKKEIVASLGYFDWNYKTGSLVISDENNVTEIAQLCQNLSGDTIVSLYHTFEDVNGNANYGNFQDMLVRRQICINRSGKSDYIMDKLVGTGDTSSVAAYLDSQNDSIATYAMCNGKFSIPTLTNLLEYYVDTSYAGTAARMMNLMGSGCVNTGANVANAMSTWKLGKTFEQSNLSNLSAQNILKHSNFQNNKIKLLLEYYISGTGANTTVAAKDLNLLAYSTGDLNKASQIVNIVKMPDIATIINDTNVTIPNAAAILNNTNLAVVTGVNVIEGLSGLIYSRLYNILMDSNITNDRISTYFSDSTFDQVLDIKLTKDIINANLPKSQDITRLQSTKNLTKTVAKVKQIGIEDGLGSMIVEETPTFINLGTGYVQKLFSYSGTSMSVTEGANIIYNLTGSWNSGGIVTGDLVRNIVNSIDDKYLSRVYTTLGVTNGSLVLGAAGRYCIGGNIVDGSSATSYAGDSAGRFPCTIPVEFYSYTGTDTNTINYTTTMFNRNDMYLYTYKQVLDYTQVVGPINNYKWQYKTSLLRGMGWVKSANLVDNMTNNILVDKNDISASFGYFDWNYKTGSLVTGDESLVTEIPQFCQNLSGDTIVKLYHNFETVNGNANYGNFGDILMRRQICINRSGKADYIMDKLVGTGDTSSVASYMDVQSDSNNTTSLCNGRFSYNNIKSLLEYYVDNSRADAAARMMNLMGSGCVNTGANVANIITPWKLGKIFEHANITNLSLQNVLKNANLSNTVIKNVLEFYVSGTGNNTLAAANQLNLLSFSTGDTNKAAGVTNITNSLVVANIFNHANMSISNSALILNNTANLTVTNGIGIINNLSGISYTRLYNILMDNNISNDRIATYFADATFDQLLDVKLTKDMINSNLSKSQDVTRLQSTKNMSKTVAKIKQIGVDDGLSTLVVEESPIIINAGTGYLQKLFSYSGTSMSVTEGANIIYNLTGSWNSGGIVTGDLVRNIVNAIDDKYLNRVYSKLGVDNGGLLLAAVGRYCIGGNIADGSSASTYTGDSLGRFPCTVPTEYYSFVSGSTNYIPFIYNMYYRNDTYLYTYKQTLDFTQLVGPLSSYQNLYKVSLIRGLGGRVNRFLNNAGGSLKNDFCTMISTHKGTSIDLSGGVWVTNTEFTNWCPTYVSYFDGDGTSGNPYRKLGESASATTVLATGCQSYNLNATTLNNGGARGAGSCGNGTQACLSDGLYMIDPDGVGGNNAFQGYCDMTTNGGGWTLSAVNNSAGTASGWGVGSRGSITAPSQGTPAKLSDVVWSSLGTVTRFKFLGGTTGYVKFGSVAWSSTGNNYDSQSNPVYQCSSDNSNWVAGRPYHVGDCFDGLTFLGFLVNGNSGYTSISTQGGTAWVK